MTAPLTILHMLPDLEVGGGQVLLNRIIRAMDPERFRHVVCAVRPEGDMRADFGFDGIRVADLRSAVIRSAPVARMRLRWLLSRESFDVVHSNNTREDLRMAVRACEIAHLPLVVTLHGYFHPARTAAELAARNEIWPRARPYLKAALAVSDPVRETWLRHFRDLGLPDDRLRTFLPILDVERFNLEDREAHRKGLRSAFGLPPDAVVISSIGRLVAGKGFRRILEAFAEVAGDSPKAHLLLIGDGPLRDDLAQQAVESGTRERIVFAGMRDDIPAILAGTDIFAFASESESFGLSPCEAMAAGVPVVMMALPSLEAIMVNGETALVSPEGDMASFTGNLRRLLMDAHAARAMGAAGQQRAATVFDPSITADLLRRTYEEAVS